MSSFALKCGLLIRKDNEESLKLECLVGQAITGEERVWNITRTRALKLSN